MKSKSKMSILVESFFYTECGPILTMDIARGLQENGIDVCVIIPEQMENLDDWKKYFSAECLYIWKTHKNKYVDNLLNGIKIWFKFLNRRFAFALYPSPVTRNLIVEKFVRVRENIIFLHDPIPHSGTKISPEQAIEEFKKFLTNVDNVLVMSKQFIPIVEEKYNMPRNNIFYMRHGTMTYPKFAGTFGDEELKGSLNFLYFGRIQKYKGLHVLSEAFDKVQKQYPNTYLTVAGSGDFSEYEEEYAALNNTTVMNKYITDDEIAYLFSKPNTVVVMPYIDATQSGITGMAYNYETPIISTDTGGLREQLFDGEVGVFVKPGDADDLAEKMICFLSDPNLFAEQKKLMQESKEKMSWKYITNELIEQLDSHLNGENK